MSRAVLQKLAEKYEKSNYYPKKDTGFQRLTSEKCLLIFLWYASHEASSFRDVADRFNIAISTLHGIVENLSIFLSKLSSSVIIWPSPNEQIEICNAFEMMGFPGAKGCIDGSHIRIDKPTEDAE